KLRQGTRLKPCNGGEGIIIIDIYRVKDTTSRTLCADDVVDDLTTSRTTCSSCGYPAAKTRKYEWSEKAKRRKTTGTGRMAHITKVHRRFAHGFRTGLAARKTAAPAS
ncbi:Ribosomal protein L37, partial [Taphrina deformans PYCC 5710]